MPPLSIRSLRGGSWGAALPAGCVRLRAAGLRAAELPGCGPPGCRRARRSWLKEAPIAGLEECLGSHSRFSTMLKESDRFRARGAVRVAPSGEAAASTGSDVA